MEVPENNVLSNWAKINDIEVAYITLKRFTFPCGYSDSTICKTLRKYFEVLTQIKSNIKTKQQFIIRNIYFKLSCHYLTTPKRRYSLMIDRSKCIGDLTIWPVVTIGKICVFILKNKEFNMDELENIRINEDQYDIRGLSFAVVSFE